ncbi:hypothetical protein NPIL_244581 [Nephila pilipes]|uniref:Uncharacterized protein n=1 Tax=Nephila pilipes TaxID=299642 RepID=A0A8X6NJL5_NEPPI|nr:hypothetical protein NPIL_244581 [Nephila pilipes]
MKHKPACRDLLSKQPVYNACRTAIRIVLESEESREVIDRVVLVKAESQKHGVGNGVNACAEQHPKEWLVGRVEDFVKFIGYRGEANDDLWMNREIMGDYLMIDNDGCGDVTHIVKRSVLGQSISVLRWVEIWVLK